MEELRKVNRGSFSYSEDFDANEYVPSEFYLNWEIEELYLLCNVLVEHVAALEKQVNYLEKQILLENKVDVLKAEVERLKTDRD